MSFAAETGPLAAEDARALKRLLRRTLGRGFRLVVIEVATPRLRKQIVEWLTGEVAALTGRLVEVDVRSLPGENLWAELGELVERGEERLLLALHGFQEAVHGRPDDETGIYRQLNVQRDLFVRDLGWFWVLLIHPQGSRKLQDIAPDFCDFSSLWIRVPEDELEPHAAAPPPSSPATEVSLALDRRQPNSELLQQAAEAITTGEYTRARDLLTRFELTMDTADAHAELMLLRGHLELRRGNLDAARRLAERALAQNQADDDEVEVASALDLLGNVLAAQSQYEQARAAVERSLAIKENLNLSLTGTLVLLAGILGAQGDADNARDVLERAVALARSPVQQANALHELASGLRARGDFAVARSKLEQALQIRVQTYGSDKHPEVAKTLFALAQVRHAQGDLDTARELVERAIEIETTVHGTELHADIAASYHELATIMGEQGDLEGARLKLERALEIDAEVFGTQTHANVAATRHELAMILRAQGDLDGARRELERALAISTQVFGTELHPAVADTLHGLAVLLVDDGALDEASSTFERALTIKSRVLGPDHVSTSMTETTFAHLLLERGDRDRARTLLEHACPILARTFGPNHAWVEKADALFAVCVAGGSE